MSVCNTCVSVNRSPFLSRYKCFDDLLYNLATARARRMKPVQLASTRKAGDHVTGTTVDNVAVTWTHPTQLAGLQYSLWLALCLHIQGVLALTLGALLRVAKP